MKYINRIMLLLVASVSLLTACQDEMEVGDLLYPVEADDPTPRLYVYTQDLSGYDLDTKFAETPQGVVAPTQEMTFTVKLSKPVSHDVVVSLVESPELAAEYNASAEAMPVGTVTFSPETLTIPAGATETSEAVTVTITNQEALAALEETGVVAVSFEGDTPDVKTSTTRGAVYWTLTKEFTNVRQGNLEGKTELTSADWTFTYLGVNYWNEMFDGTLGSWNYGYLRMQTGYMQFDFGAPKAIAGFSYVTPQYLTYYRYGFARMQILTSDDGQDWTDQGVATLPSITANNQWIDVEFYSPVVAQYYRIVGQQRSDGNDVAGNSIYIGEFKVYE